MTVAATNRVPGTSLASAFTLSVVGDCITTRPLLPLAQRDPAFADVVALLRGSDATFGNFEATIVDLADTAAVPSALPDDWAIRSAPETALDLRALGFDIFGRANNHSTDWGIGGLLETSMWLDEAALVHAGAGPTLAAARAPRYLETDAGRLGLVSMTTSAASGTFGGAGCLRRGAIAPGRSLDRGGHDGRGDARRDARPRRHPQGEP